MTGDPRSRPAPSVLDGDTRRARSLEVAFVAVGLALVVGYRSFEPVWEVGRGLIALGLLSGLSYVAGQFIYRRSVPGGLLQAVKVALIVTQPLLLTLWALDLPVSRVALAGELVLLVVAIAAVGWAWPSGLRVVAAGAFAGLAALPTVVGFTHPDTSPPAGHRTHYRFTSYHDLSVTTHEVMPGEAQDGGALELMSDGRILLVAGSGDARLIRIGQGGEVEAKKLDLRLPLDVSSYRATVHYQPQFYRVIDVLRDADRLFASYVHWEPNRACYTLRLAEAAFDGSTAGPWKVRFESTPCVPLPYAYNTSGGRIAALDQRSLLLSVGTFGIDDVSKSQADYEGWREASDYGKILVLNRDTWEGSVLTRGHRNPQGLLVAGRRIWSTEHGPHGGDELNLIRAGSDYGWPFVSYGTDYGVKRLELGGSPGDHDGYEQPVHAWIPSIGISNLIEVTGGQFPLWQGDLLIGSLGGLGNGRSVFRVRLLEGRAVAVEKIPVDSKVRDLVQLPEGGPLVLWDGLGNIRVLRAADHVFSQCSGCHTVRNAQHGIGPDLYGIVGQPVARHVNYPYSDAIRRFGGDWTVARLDGFLADPRGRVPGTSMEHEGVVGAAERAEIIKFLSEVSAGRRTR